MRRILLFILLALLLVMPTMAQEVTESPGIEPTIEATPPIETPDDALPTESLVGRIAGYVAAFFGGFLTMAAAGLAYLPRILSQVRNDRMMLALIESLAKSAPKELLDRAIMVGAAAGDLSAIIGEATDDTPVKDKPPAGEKPQPEG